MKNIVEKAISFEEVERVPVAPVLTINSKNVDKIDEIFMEFLNCCQFDGFLLHPKTFITGYLYTPCKVGREEPEPTIKHLDDYDDLIYEGCIDFAFKKHNELKLMENLEELVEEAVSEVSEFVDKWEKGAGKAIYCGSLSIAPFGFIAYHRGLLQALKDVARYPEIVKDACFTVADELSNYTAEIAKKVGVRRVWISLAYSTPDVLGGYFNQFSWLPLKVMVKNYVEKGITPILQFDTNVEDILERFKELPKRKCILHFDSSTNILRVKEVIGDVQCIAGNIPLEMIKAPEEVERYCQCILEKCRGTGFILSSDSGSPLILSKGCSPKLKAFIKAGRNYGLVKA